ncbi:MAG: hypothetical protein K2G18_04000 [Bacteroidales bacterium]|nr:hypothetical protein [Bacteroidales bacterium]
MKNIVKKYCSVLLVLWYCVSVIGFDVHTCNGSGRSFLANFISGMSCSEIHPGHVCGILHYEPCGHSGCCSHGSGSSGCCHGESSATDDCADGILACVSPDCCSDHYQVLSLTGVHQEDSHRHYDECHCGHCPCLGEFSGIPFSVKPSMTAYLNFSGSVSFVPAHPETLSCFGVWRI